MKVVLRVSIKILVICFALTLVNCEKDDEQLIGVDNIQTNSNIKITTLYKAEIKQDKRLINKIEKLQTTIKSKSNSSSSNREVYNAEYDFSINTDYAKHIDNGVNHTYTFPVYREQDNGFLENLLLVEQDDNNFKTYIVRYELTEEEIIAINFLQPVNMEGKFIFIEINDNELSDDIFGKYYYNGSCYEDNYVYQPATNCLGEENHPYSDGSECPLWGTIQTATSGGYVNIPTLVSCDTQGGSSNPNPNTSPSNPNPHGNPSPNNPPAPTTTITCKFNCFPDTDPIDDCILTLSVALSNLDLSDPEICWINDSDQDVIRQTIEQYLTDNNNSQEAEFFVQEAIVAMMEGGEVDFDDNVILSPEFKNNTKLKCVYDKLAGDDSTLFRNTIGTFIDNPTANLIFDIGECAGTDTACTDDSNFAYTGIMTIRIEDYNTNPIELAQIILHEAIHAELAKYVLEYDSGVNVNDRPRLFELYKFYKESNVPDYHLDHPYMSIYYVNSIASALREFDNNSYPLDYYKSIAWDGLRAWDVNSVLDDPLTNVYEDYRPIVIENSTVCN